MNKAVVTRRFYRFEDRQENRHPGLVAERPMAELQRLAARIWQAERQTPPVPVVVAGRGTPGGDGGWGSYCEADGKYWDTKWQYRIVLARHQRSIWVLLHELAHATVPHAKLDHGPAFARMFLYLITTYGRADGRLLALAELEGLV